jgi:hypothetical protein
MLTPHLPIHADGFKVEQPKNPPSERIERYESYPDIGFSR